MSTTNAISANAVRNSGGTVLNGGNIDNENVANAPGISILGLPAKRGSNPYNTLISTIREDFERGVLGTSTWGSGLSLLGSSIPTLQNLAGSSGIYSPTPGSAGNAELLYISSAIAKPFQADILFYTLDSTNANPGSPGLIYRNHGSGFIHVQLRQSTGGIGLMHRISYAWNGGSGLLGARTAMTHLVSGIQTTNDFNLLRKDSKEIVKLGMRIEGSGITMYVNDIASISGDVPRQLTDDATFVGIRSVADSTPDCNYDIFEIFENLTNDRPSLQRSTTAAPIHNGQTILSDNKSIRNTLDDGRPAHRQKLNDLTTKKGGEPEVPVTQLPYYDETQTDSYGSGVKIDRINQSSLRYQQGRGIIAVPTSTGYDAKN